RFAYNIPTFNENFYDDSWAASASQQVPSVAKKPATELDSSSGTKYADNQVSNQKQLNSRPRQQQVMQNLVPAASNLDQQRIYYQQPNQQQNYQLIQNQFYQQQQQQPFLNNAIDNGRRFKLQQFYQRQF